MEMVNEIQNVSKSFVRVVMLKFLRNYQFVPMSNVVWLITCRQNERLFWGLFSR